MKYILFFLCFLIPFEVNAFEKLNGNRLVLLTSLEAKKLKESEQKELMRVRATNICHLIGKTLSDFSFVELNVYTIYEKPKNPEKNRIYTEDVPFYKIPEKDNLIPVSVKELEAIQPYGRMLLAMTTLGFVNFYQEWYAIILKDITCVDTEEVRFYPE